jgi:hypothetical protein
MQGTGSTARVGTGTTLAISCGEMLGGKGGARALGRAVIVVVRAHVEEALVLAGSAALFAWASRPAARWLVDDAGISFVYGMNLGRHGELAANLEGTAAEGFSNPLNVLLVAALSAARCFHPLTTHHAVDTAVFALIGLFAFRILRHASVAPWWSAWMGVALFLGLEVCTPATMIWYGSGLENGQLTLAVLVLLWRLRRGVERGFRPWIDGPIVACAALVRPEAPLFSAVWLCAAFVLARWVEPPPEDARRSRGQGLLATAAVTTALLGAALALRYALFASLLPNTFYAKVDHVDLRRNFADYVRPALGSYWSAFGLSSSVVGLFASVRMRSLALPVLVFSGASLALPLVAGSDWMGHHRFATAFLMMGHFSFAAASTAAWAGTPSSIRVVLRQSAPAAIPAASMLFCLAPGRAEYQEFSRQRYVSFAMIADFEGFERVRLQRYLGLVYPVVALPDAGGSLAVGSMQIVDTAWLTDYQMARIRGDPRLVTRYELDERNVDLAEYHYWSFDKNLVGSKFLEAARFDAGPDFADFRPSYAVRRDLVEVEGPDAASVPLGSTDRLEVYWSSRTVPVGAPGALLRVELLVSPVSEPWDANCKIEVTIDGASDSRRVFTLSAPGDTAFTPTAGRWYRHGFLVQLPSRSGDYPVTVRVCEGANGAVFEAPRRVLVRAPVELTAADLGDRRDRAPATWMEDARWVAELREQLVRRLSPARYARWLGWFRASRRHENRTRVEAYDALLEDSRPGFLEATPPPVRAREREVLAAANEAMRGRSAWTRSARERWPWRASSTSFGVSDTSASWTNRGSARSSRV